MNGRAGDIQVRVRYSECDPMGYAHHGSYATWFELGRTELLRAGGVRYRDLETEGLFIVVAHLSIDYLRPIRYDDLLVVSTRLARITRARIEHAYEIAKDGLSLTRGRTTLACVDRAGRLQPVPAVLRPLAAEGT